MARMGVSRTKADGRGMMEDVVSLLKEFMENEARSGSMDLTLSKSLTLGKAQVNFALLSLNRDCWVCYSAVCV
jgi:hypothetical protein